MAKVIKKSTSNSEVVKKKKEKTAGLSTRERMLKRKDDLSKKGGGGLMIFIKEGVTRLRLKSQGDDKEIGLELVQFYLGKDLGSVISPATFGEDCPFMEAYKKLKDSSKEADNKLAALLIPKRRYVVAGIGYKDEKGKEIDPDRIDRPFLVTRSVYQDIIDLYLDEDEWGDMTDSEDGYDIKISRAGSGKMDTNYSVSPCQRRPLPSKYHGTVDLEQVVRDGMDSYDVLQEKLDKFINTTSLEEDEEEERPRKRDKDRSNVSGKKKKRPSSDI